jgi:hypothetical protein
MTENNGSNNGRDDKGKFLPGNPGKPKGSSKNKLRDEIKTFLNENWKEFPTWFAALKPKEKIECMLDLLPFAVPRLQSIAMTDTEGNDLPKGPVIDWTKLSEKSLKEVLSLTSIEDGNENA